MLNFRRMLTEAVKHAKTGDDLAKRLYHEGDAEHLKRWLDDNRAAAIFDKLSGGKYTVKDGFNLMMTVLRVRELAEETDALNTKFANLDRLTPRLATKQRRFAMRQLSDGEVPPEALAAHLADITKIVAKSASNLDPIFAVRSDEGGTRRRTIFCRVLSDIFHHASGKWHDAEVAALCEIALDCGHHVTTDAVRGARRGLKPRR